MEPFPEEQQKILLGVGDWLKINGEAIYGTRAWKISGEDSKTPRISYRFTTQGNTLYALTSTWPEQQVLLTTLAKGKVVGNVESVSLLGYKGKITFTQDEEGLKVTLTS